MTELIFRKHQSGFIAPIKISKNQNAIMQLDTGSPITVISIPDILALTEEKLSLFRIRVEQFINKYGTLDFGVYGSQITRVKHLFVPYVVKDIEIGHTKVPRFMFWVDVTFYNKMQIEPTSILFGYDYVYFGKKYFDNDDSFHIQIDNISPDTKSIGYALSNIDDRIDEIALLMRW